MKIERLKDIPQLYQFIENNLPEGLKTCHVTAGYGILCYVEIKPQGWFQQRIAKIDKDEIEIFLPQYFSDIENIVNLYEIMSGKEVTIKLWEKP